MSIARANANQALYLAKILLSAWRRDSDAAEVADASLRQAYLPAVRMHLVHAYGWFLLEVRGEELSAGMAPPAGVAELPEISAGRAVAGELREFQRLEQDGWLASLLAATTAAQSASRAPGNLASPAIALEDLAQASAWADSLESLFGRMRDSLDEF